MMTHRADCERPAAGVHYDKRQVRDSIDIVELIGEYVPLKRAGSSSRYVGLCPLHTEKTPSLSVNQARQSYKCFGCGAFGDVFKFVMEVEGVTFPNALKMLADRAGIQPACRWSAADRSNYARAASGADVLAQRLTDFTRGLELLTDQRVRLLGALDELCIEMPDSALTAHQYAHLLRQASPREIAEGWRVTESNAREAIERIGRDDHEHAESITRAIVELLVIAEQKKAAA